MEHALHTSQARPIWAYLGPRSLLEDLWRNRRLAWQFARRQIEARYKGQHLGLVWAILTPLVMLGIYTFAFAVVFRTYWRAPGEPTGEYALAVFAALLAFGVFREVLLRAPGAVIGHRNYVKRMVFPLQILAPADAMAALVNMGLGVVVWVAGWVWIMRSPPHPQLLLVPVLMLPLVLTAIGAAWVVSALGVFLRDLANVVELGVMMLFFLTPIFYTLDRVPERARWVLSLNPLAASVEDIRRVMMLGAWPDWSWFAGSLAGSAVIAVIGYAFFMKSKRAFADVV